MALTAEQHRLRDGKVTGSFAPYLMAGDAEKITREWMRLVGDPSYAPENLDEVWPVQFGSFVESFALDWHQKKCGPIGSRGQVITHPDRPYASVTLDGFRPSDACVLDVKAIGAYRKIDDVCGFYAPQLVMQRDCVGAQKAALLIVHGGAEPQEYPIEITPDYAAQVWQRVDWFYACVESLTPPIALQGIAAPVAAVKEYDMRESNAWGEFAGVWLEYHPAAKRFASAEKELKALVPADAMRCYGHSVVCKRDRAGRLSISAIK